MCVCTSLTKYSLKKSKKHNADISSVINTKYDSKQNVPCSQNGKTQSKAPFPCKNSQIFWSLVSISDTQTDVLGFLKLLMVRFISVYQNTYIWPVCR